MWLVYALVTFIAWGAADLFYKKSNREDEPYSHLKTSVVVGLVMGATAVVTLVVKQIHYDPINLLIYFPVSLMYILSMTVGYFGLRYLKVSVSSPIQNASGAVSGLLLMIVLRRFPGVWSCIAIALVTAGVIFLGIEERKEENLQKNKTGIGFVAFFMPILYCLIDSLGTFFDGWYLDDIATTPLVGVTEETFEDVANISYQLTFLIVAILLMVYIHVIKKQPVRVTGQKSRVLAALCETAGQITYVYALSGNGIVAAPVIASYCVATVLFGRIFLKEKLKQKQYLAVLLVLIGIIILGIIEGLTA